jgi:hypothetical protein
LESSIKNHLSTKSFFMTTAKESFRVKGEQLLNKIKELIKEGNVRKITIHDHTGKEIMSFPLTLGVVGTLIAPVLAAIGALAALIGDCTITVEREEEKTS